MEQRELTKPYPTYEDCCYLWKRYETPPHVIRHCRAVSKTAVLIAWQLNRKGYHLNIDLLRTAGLLHDMMRLSPDHGSCAAGELRRLGYADAADAVAVHMSYRLDPEKKTISETDLLCFADRLVKEDSFVGLDERMEYIIEKSRQYHDPGAEPRIRKSFQETKRFQKNIETIIEMAIHEIPGMTDPLGG